MLEVTRNGSFPSMKEVCHPAAGKEEEVVTSNPTCMVEQAPPISSRITKEAVVGARGLPSGLLGG